MCSRTDRNLTFQHTAYHALYSVTLSRITDTQSLMDSSCFHQLDIQIIGCMLFHNTQGILAGKYTFICENGGRCFFGNIFQSFKIMTGNRLLHKLNICSRLLHGRDGTHSFLPAPALVRVHTDAHILSNRITDSADSLHILRTAFSDFHLQNAETFLHCTDAVPDHLLCFVDTDGEICLQRGFHCRRIRRSQQTEKRLLFILSVQIIQCNIYSRFCRCIFCNGFFHFFHDGRQIIQIHPADGRSNISTDCCLNGFFCITGNHSCGRSFSISLRSVFRSNSYDQIADTVYCPKSSLKGCNQRNADIPHCNFFYFHNTLHAEPAFSQTDRKGILFFTAYPYSCYILRQSRF